MKNIEYEYSFNVKDLTPYIDYCEKHGYKFIEKTQQQRTIYRKPDGTMARITINTSEKGTKKYLDFKEDNFVEGQVLKQHKESLSLNYEDDEVIDSILQFLEYRTRYIYELKAVKFELDEYTVPRKTCVVAVEGDKVEVDKVYQKIIKIK